MAPRYELQPPRVDHDRAAEPARPRVATAAEQVLALQASVGNRAVSAALAREPTKGAPPKDATKEATGQRIVLGRLGTIALDSASFAGQPQTGGGAGTARENEQRELRFSSRIGDHTPGLTQAAVSGEQFDADLYMRGGMVVHITGAMISSYSASGSDEGTNEAWTLNATSITFSSGEGEKKQDE